uniref:Uncharacterized protein n=1 Tax=Anguilla anguilla TaxID=7936 RepID=A0A0E9QGL0_ANGAN
MVWFSQLRYHCVCFIVLLPCTHFSPQKPVDFRWMPTRCIGKVYRFSLMDMFFHQWL